MRIKICGITAVADAEAAIKLGADAIGVVFYEPSPRNVSDLRLAKKIALSVGPFVSVVGLFVNASTSFVEEVLSCVPLTHVQFHGDETGAFCRQFCRPYMKAIRMKEGVSFSAVEQEFHDASAILLDAYVKGIPGGTGHTFNWQRVPNESSVSIVLAGGLTPSNASDASKVPNIYGLDVSGGVESTPGRKDENKIEAFILNAQSE